MTTIWQYLTMALHIFGWLTLFNVAVVGLWVLVAYGSPVKDELRAGR